MPALQFTWDLADAICADRKTQTLRNSLPRGALAGVTLTLFNGYRAGSRIGSARIASIDQVRREDLTHEDAVLDGFESLQALQDRLDAMSASETLWRIRWADFIPDPTFARPVVAQASTRRTRTPRRDDYRRANRAVSIAPR